MPSGRTLGERIALVAAMLAALLWQNGSAVAGATAWQEIAAGAQLRVISSDVLKGGHTTLALELQMAQGLQTYWRVPGETGVATQVSLSNGAAAIDANISWPFPIRETKDGYVDHIYREYLVLPVDFAPPAGASALDVDVFMGICSDICVPVKAQFLVPLHFEEPDVGTGIRIKQAVQLSPIAWDGGDSPFGEILFDEKQKDLLVEVDAAIVDPATIIASVDDTGYVFAPPLAVAGRKGVIALRLLSRLPEQGLQGKTVRLTFMTSEGAYEIERKL